MVFALLESSGFLLIGFYHWMGALFSSDGFVPRWHCGDWHPVHVYTDVGSDLVTALSYFGLPGAIAWFALRTQDSIPAENRWVPWAFANFIFWCGVNHFNAPLAYWWPAYRYFTAVKFVMAMSSLPTMAALVPTVREAVHVIRHAKANRENRERLTAEVLRQAQELQKRNKALEAHIARLEQRLERGSDELSIPVEIEQLRRQLHGDS